MPAAPQVTADAAVIGAGVVGLAVARALALGGREVVVLEAEAGPGRHTSSRNSGVVHAGLHHPPGHLKARLCVRGRQLLLAYCAERGVPHARPGKLVVATSDEEVPALGAILARARACGVADVEPLDAAQVRALEPEVRAVRGLLSPSTGIVDPEALVRALRRDVEAAGGAVACSAPVRGGRAGEGFLDLDVGGAEPFTLRCRAAVNAAGHGAQAVARAFEGLDARTVPPLRLAKGTYFTLAGPAPFRRLVYPVPHGGGLGTHLTLDLAGGARFGPDLEWVDRVAYAVDEARAPAFEASVRRWWPGLPQGALRPGFAGVRPKLAPPGAPDADFAVHGPDVHGVPGLVCLYGIDSPGLTASLALGEHVAGMV